MERELLILRHAKSSWGEDDKADVDRPLKYKGISDISFIASKSMKISSGIQKVVTSHAIRAVHTAILFSSRISLPLSNICIDDRIYTADDYSLRNIIDEFPDDLTKALIVGHNPTLTYFVNLFLNNQIIELPTSGLVYFKFKAKHWREISPETLVNSDFIKP